MSKLRLSFMAALIGALLLTTGWTAISGQTSTRLEVRLAETEAGPGLTEAAVPGSAQRVYLHSETIVTSSDVAGARVVPGDGGSGFNVAVVFNSGGSDRMARATQGHLNKPVAIILERPIMALALHRSRTCNHQDSPCEHPALFLGQPTIVVLRPDAMRQNLL